MEDYYQQACLLLRLHFGEMYPGPASAERALVKMGYVTHKNKHEPIRLTKDGRRLVSAMFAAMEYLVEHGTDAPEE